MNIYSNVFAKMYGENYVNLNSPNIVNLGYNSTSKGNQHKYYDVLNKRYIKGQFEYQGVLWKDYMVENLSSIIGSQLNTEIKVVKQNIVKLSNGNMGCISDDFAIDKEWVPLAKLTDTVKLSKNFNKSFRVFSDILNVYTSIGIDIELSKEYLSTMIILDFLLGNEDRHFNNIGVLFDINTSRYDISPLFDFGLGLFEHDTKYDVKYLYAAKALMEGKPFSKDLSDAFDMIINVCGIDKIRSMCCDIVVPDKSLFPNELGYEYFIDSYKYMKGKLSL